MTQTPPDLRAALVQLREKWLSEAREFDGGVEGSLRWAGVMRCVADLDALLALDHPSGEAEQLCLTHSAMFRCLRCQPLPPPPVEPQ